MMARDLTRRPLLLATCLVWAVAPRALATKVVVCRDDQGRLMFTDQTGVCLPADAPRRVTAAMEKPGAVNFRTPARRYQKSPGDFQVLIESDMARSEPELTSQATRKLQQTLADVTARLPVAARQHMKTIKYHLMWGEKSPQGGLKSGMRYVRLGEASNNPLHDPGWHNAIVVYSTTNWMYLDELWSRKALVHEMAHAWHVAHWPDRYSEILDAWRAAKDAGLYAQVANRAGKTLGSAYAAANQMEYFAELSAIYFVGGDYAPFDREGLKRHDPRGYRLVEALWGVTKP